MKRAPGNTVVERAQRHVKLRAKAGKGPFEWLSVALKAQLQPSGRKFVLVCITAHADEDGHATPSQAMLCVETCQSRRTVQQHIAVLEAEGWLQRVKRRDGQGRYDDDAFDLDWEKMERSSGVAEPCADSAHGDSADHAQNLRTDHAQISTPPCADSDIPPTPPYIDEDTVEDINARAREAAPAGGAAASTRSWRDADSPSAERVFDAGACAALGLSDGETALVRTFFEAGWQITRTNRLWLGKQDAVMAALGRRAYFVFADTLLPQQDDGETLTLAACNAFQRDLWLAEHRWAAGKAVGRRIDGVAAHWVRPELQRLKDEGRNVGALMAARHPEAIAENARELDAEIEARQRARAGLEGGGAASTDPAQGAAE